MCSQTKILILLYPILLLLLLFNGVKSMENVPVPLKNEENANDNQFMDSMIEHFEHFGTPYKPLEMVEYELGKNHIIKTNAKSKKVEWRLAEINSYVGIKEWTSSEFSMLDDRNAKINKKKMASAMTDYANCVKKMPKMIIKKDEKTKKLFMLNGTITILDMKPITRKDQAYLVKYVPDFSGNEKQIIEAVPTHFCTSLFIVENENDGKISEYKLVCTRIDLWAEKNDPSKNIGKKATDCGHSELHDNQLPDDEHLKSIGVENMLEFVQIKFAMDLTKNLQHFGVNLVEEKKQKKEDQNLPIVPISFTADQHQIEKMNPNLRIYKGFMVEYDPRKMVAHWLLERLTHENAVPKNPIQRLNWDWNADQYLAKMFQPNEEDYQMAKQFKLNHGHLAAFRAHSENVDQETFLYPNSVPQDWKINSGYWRVIEEYTLCLVEHEKSIAYVYTGPLFIPEKNIENGQWQMKYKVIGKKKMLAVPTHLFKTILLESKNDNAKKSFYLETFVVSNGQEGEMEVGEAENLDEGGQHVEELVEEEEEVNVEVEMSNNIFYNLVKDEAEIFKMLKESSDKGKENAPTYEEGIVDVKKTGQKNNKENEKTIPAAGASEYIKKTDRIKTLVEGCQNRRYKINYGDAKGHKISELLEQHRKPLTFIDKFAPNFQLLAKLPTQLRAGKNESDRKGVHFDQDILAKLIKNYEKGKDKAAGTKGKGTKVKGKAKNKWHQKNQHQPTTFVHVAQDTSATIVDAKLEFFEKMEKLLTEYLLNIKLNVEEEIYLRNGIQLHTRWHEIQSLLQFIKTTMQENKVVESEKMGAVATQIDAIELELYRVIEDKKFLQINEKTPSYSAKDAIKLANVNICQLIHLHESIFYTFFSASSQQKSNTLRANEICIIAVRRAKPRTLCTNSSVRFMIYNFQHCAN